MDPKFIFLAKFFALFLILQAIVLVVDLTWMQNAIAAGVSSLDGTAYSGKFVNVKDGAFEITPSCTGLVIAAILAAVIFSMKKPDMKKKAALFLTGTAILLVLNYFRVLLVVIVGRDFGIGAAEILHVISWFVMSAGIILIWYVFTKKMTKTESFDGFL